MTQFLLDNSVVLIAGTYLLYNINLFYLKYFKAETNTDKYDLIQNYVHLETVRNKRAK